MKTIQKKKAIAGVAAMLFAGTAAAFATGVLSTASAATSHNLMIKAPAGVVGVKIQSDPSKPYGPCLLVKEKEWNSVGVQVNDGDKQVVAGYSDVACATPIDSGAFAVPADLKTENFWYDWDAGRANIDPDPQHHGTPPQSPSMPLP